MSTAWLPSLVLFADYDNDWERYEAALYAYFQADWIQSRPEFRGTKLGLKRHPVIQGKEATFWHLISEGRIEEERTPDFRRCERIRWSRPILEHGDEPVIKVWENERKGEKRICLWFEAEEYLVILAKRAKYILLWTAFTVTQKHRKEKLQREYETFING